jgi:hypothetical protein
MRDVVERPRGGGLRQVIALLALGFIVTLGVVVGTRMSSDAIAVLVGVIAGVAASIPCALLLMAVTRHPEKRELLRYDSQQYEDRRHNDWRYSERMDPRRAAPPVVIVTPGQAVPQQLPYAASFSYPPAPAQSQRQFRVMGYEEPEAQPVGGQAATAPWQG